MIELFNTQNKIDSGSITYKCIGCGSGNITAGYLYQNEEIRQTSLARLINPNLVSKSYENHLISNSVEKEEKIQYIRINDSDSAFMYIKEDLNGLTPYDCMEEVGGNKND